MSNLQGHVGELTFSVQVTRKDTGAVENYTLVGGVTEEQAKQLGLSTETSKEHENGRHS